MQTRILKITGEDSDGQVISEAAAALRDGQLVVFPTETVYGVGADASSASAIEALQQLKTRVDSKPFTLHISEPEEALKYVAKPSPWGNRLMHRAWPGPVTIIFPAAPGRTSGLVESALYFEGRIGLRCPDHPVAAGILAEAGVPVVASSANRAGQSPPRNAEQALAELEGKVPLLVDAGPTRYGKASTVVLLNEDGFRVVREGVIPAHGIEKMARTTILFVCTANMGRSAMGAALAETLLAQKYGVSPHELERLGVVIKSAGVAAPRGAEASGEAQEAVSDYGATLENHRSQMLSLDLILSADYIFAMTRSHLEITRETAPEAAGRVELLDPDGQEIDDPVGGGSAAYRRCAQTIYEALKKQLAEKVI